MPAPADEPDDPLRRGFLAASAALAALPAAALDIPMRVPRFAHEEASISALAGRLNARELTSVALVEDYLARIEAIDRAGPQLRAVIEINPDALALARVSDAERRAGRTRGPLHGVPILLKDNIGTADRMKTSAGALVLESVQVRRDAHIARRLREAGAVVLGKTNLSEWANFRSSPSISGWSSRGGQTRNPYAPDRSPSGSSSGSAVAVAANLCAAAIGTETDGSIVSPAACNNIVGFKPSLGLVSRAGIIPIAHSQDTAGPMARTVEDCALLMNALFGADPQDAATVAAGVPPKLDFTAHLGLPELKGVRIGVARQYLGVNEKVDALFEAALVRLRELGADLVDVEHAHHGRFSGAEYEVLLHEFKAGLNAWLQAHAPDAPVRTLAELIEYNERHRDRVMPLFGQSHFIRAQAKGPLTDAAYVEALAGCRRMTRTEGIDAMVAKYGVEAFVAPTASPPWLIDPVNGDSGRGGCSSLPAVAGYPHVTVPAGFITPPAPYRGTAPVGLSFFGPAFSDARLLGIAQCFERASRQRRSPFPA